MEEWQMRPYDTKLEISSAILKINKMESLGKGHFASVYLGNVSYLKDPVAVKLCDRLSTLTAIRGLLREIKVLSYLRQNENIVGLVGASTSGLWKGKVCLALELCSNGSLKDHLSKLRDEDLHVNENVIKSFVKWSYEITSGMEFVASKGVVHGDLASRNVLLSESFTCKIADFGLSRKMDSCCEEKLPEEEIAWRWMSIEVLRDKEYSEKSDVWSFGVTMFEIFSLGETPYAGLSYQISFVEELQQGLRLSQPAYAGVEIYNVMKRCWDKDKLRRSRFTELRRLIFKVKET